MKADLILYNIGYLITSKEIAKMPEMSNMENIEILNNAFVAIKDGKFYRSDLCRLMMI